MCITSIPRICVDIPYGMHDPDIFLAYHAHACKPPVAVFICRM
jgi:hypothetical protein